ncbi:hypothetical protein ACFO0E_10475 [Chromohalobacter beijerinckii]|uniref:Pyocin activator protein PrtN n=1 Tax=Chromohalobacter beijerinckii TaxID=86179 RepID=A0ABV8XDB4_9GAMM|nr:hypothetical protein [Chromohalobacter beijerinckii]MCK0765422.1 hypothetical protein [Chromohalobacter beijerinckii]
MEETKAPQIPPFVPVMTIERFAQMSGLEEGVIQSHIRRGHLPTIKLELAGRNAFSRYERAHTLFYMDQSCWQTQGYSARLDIE